MDTDYTETTVKKSRWTFFRSWNFWKPFIGVTTGGTAGFLYWYFIGCNSGTCPITSNPYGSIIAGAILGILLTPSPDRGKKEKND